MSLWTMGDEDEREPETDEIPEEDARGDTWICPWCAHLNPATERACQQCGNPDPDKPW